MSEFKNPLRGVDNLENDSQQDQHFQHRSRDHSQDTKKRRSTYSRQKIKPPAEAKPLIRFEPEEVRAVWKQIANKDQRMSGRELKNFLAKTYGVVLAGLISDFFFKSYFEDSFGTRSIFIEGFCHGIERFVNKDASEWHRLRFSLYDPKQRGKLREKQLF